MYNWLRYAARRVTPFFIALYEEVTAYIRYNSILLHTLKHSMYTLTNLVKRSIFSYPPNWLAIMLDGHTTPKTHYVAVVAIYSSEMFLDYSSVWLSIPPLENKTKQDTNEHICFLMFVIRVFWISKSNIVKPIEGSCRFNQTIRKILIYDLKGAQASVPKLQ